MAFLRNNFSFLLLFVILILCGNLAVQAQSKKDIKSNKVKSVTEVIVKGDKTYNDAFQSFNKNGNTLEEINYDNTGKIKERITYKYNNSNKKSEQITYDSSGKQKERETYKYNADDEKVEENLYNGNNILISKSVFSFNNKGLKKQKKTYDAQGTLIQSKTYQYEY